MNANQTAFSLNQAAKCLITSSLGPARPQLHLNIKLNCLCSKRDTKAAAGCETQASHSEQEGLKFHPLFSQLFNFPNNSGKSIYTARIKRVARSTRSLSLRRINNSGSEKRRLVASRGQPTMYLLRRTVSNAQ
jgi:hypothetical protein